jgi:hypothetical protein
VDLRLLGPVQLWVGGRRLELGPRRQRHVLAVLALEVNRLLPLERLVELAWPAGPPRKPDVALTPTDATYVAQAAGEHPAMVAATHTGYGTIRDSYVYAYARDIPLPTPDATYQAEDATLSGPVVSTDNSGYTAWSQLPGVIRGLSDVLASIAW